MFAFKGFITTYLKGIVVGLGAITPGLSGSVLLVIFGLYHKALDSISTIFKNFKKNLAFLIPLIALIAFSTLPAETPAPTEITPFLTKER